MKVGWFEPKIITQARARLSEPAPKRGQQWKLFLITVIMLSLPAALNLLAPNPHTPGLWQMALIIIAGSGVIVFGLPLLLGWIPLAVEMDEHSIRIMQGTSPVAFVYDRLLDLRLDRIDNEAGRACVLCFNHDVAGEVVIGYPESKHEDISALYAAVWLNHPRGSDQIPVDGV